jgi:hypothetical protein
VAKSALKNQPAIDHDGLAEDESGGNFYQARPGGGPWFDSLGRGNTASTRRRVEAVSIRQQIPGLEMTA